MKHLTNVLDRTNHILWEKAKFLNTLEGTFLVAYELENQDLPNLKLPDFLKY